MLSLVLYELSVKLFVYQGRAIRARIANESQIREAPVVLRESSRWQRTNWNWNVAVLYHSLRQANGYITVEILQRDSATQKLANFETRESHAVSP